MKRIDELKAAVTKNAAKFEKELKALTETQRADNETVHLQYGKEIEALQAAVAANKESGEKGLEALSKDFFRELSGNVEDLQRKVQ